MATGIPNQNQHFIPQALQRGFPSQPITKKKKKKVRVWLFRRGIEPCEEVTRNIGAEHFFYGRDDETGIDPEITRLAESPFHEILPTLRETKTVLPGHIPIIANFIDNLTIRTRTLRNLLADGIQKTAESHR